MNITLIYSRNLWDIYGVINRLIGHSKKIESFVTSLTLIIVCSIFFGRLCLCVGVTHDFFKKKKITIQSFKSVSNSIKFYFYTNDKNSRQLKILKESKYIYNIMSLNVRRFFFFIIIVIFFFVCDSVAFYKVQPKKKSKTWSMFTSLVWCVRLLVYCEFVCAHYCLRLPPKFNCDSIC